MSGARDDRPGLQAALEYLRAGDTLVVWRLDRLGRSLPHLIETLSALEQRGIAFKSLHEEINIRTATGRLLFHVMGAPAQFERDLTVERVRAGQAEANVRGKALGRKPKLETAESVALAQKMRADGESIAGIARALN